MQRTQSPQRLNQVQMAVNGTIMEVWLHRNIKQVEIEGEDGLPHTMWEADEVHGTLPASTAGAYVSESFDALWDEWDDTPVHVRIAEVRETANDATAGVVEVAELAAGNETSIEEIEAALVELADIIAGGE